MSKVLLVYEDYPELMHLESSLKKVGFDVVGITSEFSMPEQLVAFNPDVVVGCGNSSKVSSLGVGRRLKEAGRWQGKSVLIFKPTTKPKPDDLLKIRADLFLEAPVQVRMMVQVLGRVLGLDEVAIQDKLDRLTAYENQAKAGNPQDSGRGGAAGFSEREESIFVGGGSGQAEDEAGRKGLFSFREKNAKELYRDDTDQSSSKSSSDSSSDTGSLFDVDLSSLETEVFGKKVSSKPATIAGNEVEQEKPAKATVPIDDGGADVDSLTSPSIDPLSSDRIRQLPPEALKERTNQSIEGTGVTALTEVESQIAVLNPASEEVFSALSAEPMDPEILQKIRGELAEVATQSVQREMIYQSFLVNAERAPKSTVTRIEARKRQKDIQKQLDAEKLGDQDQLRRAFVKAMFKK